MIHVSGESKVEDLFSFFLWYAYNSKKKTTLLAHLFRSPDPLIPEIKSLQPMTTVSSSGNEYCGTSKFKGAGPFLARPEMS